MRKIFKYALALAAVSVLATSCTHDEDMIFDDSAANRTDQAMDDYSKLLCRDGGKWVMEYFASGDERGYTYGMTFTPDQKVEMAASNEVVGYTYQTSSSLWSIKADDGVTLSFDTYNPLFHVFADPINTNTGGHGGDYEFIIIGASEDGNTLNVKGKKNRLPLTMHRVSADTDLQAIIEADAAANQNMFASSIPYVVLTTADGARYIVQDASYGVLSIYPEAGDAITQTVYGNVIITASGMRFMEPIEVPTGVGNGTIFFSSFELQPDGSLLQNDGNGTAVIAAEPMSYNFSNQSWTMSTASSELAGYYATAIPAFVEQFTGDRGMLTKIEFIALGNDTRDVQLMITARFRSGSQYKTYEMKYTFGTAAEGSDKVTLTYKEADATGTTYYNRYTALKDFVDHFDGLQGTLTCENVMAPTPMTFTSGAGDSFRLTAK